MPRFHARIDAEIFVLRPDFRAVSIHASGMRNMAKDELASAWLEQACASPCAEPWADAHRESWREAYRAFGAKPQRTPCSAEALLKRCLRDGSVPGVNAVVDLYNAISLRHAIPIGGEDAGTYVGSPLLTRAIGDEAFDTVEAGAPKVEYPEKGEVIWRDDHGVTCRRWNWRQGVRTRIEEHTTEMWFVLEALDPMPFDALRRAADELLQGLQSISSAASLEAMLLTAEGMERMG